MNFEEALDVLTRGGDVTHNGKTFRLIHRGIHDVTDSENPVRVQLTAEDWEASPETVPPEAVDEVLHETALDDEHADTPQ